MNLVTDPWIPAVDLSGERRLISLLEAFRDGERLTDMVLTPPQRVSVMRLLVCVAQAALAGPTSEDEWRQSLPKVIPLAMGYLEQWKGRFDLYGRRAFLQIPELESQSASRNTSEKLDFELSSGNNDTLFDHDALSPERHLSDASLALVLLTYQCFSPSGTIGLALWKEKLTGGPSSSHAPCLAGNAAHTLIRGKNLTETIWLNLMTQEQVSTFPNWHDGRWGQPIWEHFPDNREDYDAIENATKTYLGRLVPLSRAVRLESDHPDLILGNGLPYGAFPAYREPTQTIVLSKGDPVPLRLRHERHVWRELDSLIAVNRADGPGGIPALRHLKKLNLDAVDIWVGGLITDKARLVDAVEWNLSLQPQALEEAFLAIYQEGVRFAVKKEAHLIAVVRRYSDELSGGEKDFRGRMRGQAAQQYWTHLDAEYGQLVELSTSGQSLQDWQRTVRKEATRAYRETCPHVTPRQIQAYARAMPFGF